MIRYDDLTRGELMAQVKRGNIQYGGDTRFRIYGRLRCKQGKRAKKEYKVFFLDEAEAVLLGYRPCGSCMYREYQIWKAGATSHLQ